MACLAVIMLCASGAAAQARFSGRVRSAQGAPIAAATVQVTSVGSRATWSAVTRSDGSFSIVLPEGPGGYTARAERLGFFALRVGFTVERSDEQYRRDFVLTAQPVALEGVSARAQRRTPPADDRRTPGGAEESWSADLLETFPVTPGGLHEIGAMEAGAVPIGDGLSVAGQPAAQTGITVDGASFGAARLPPEALRTARVAISTYDVARGQFSGGQVAASTRAGTNLFGGAVSFTGTDPALQLTPGQPGHRLYQLGGGAGGALRRDRLFVFGAMQLSRREVPFAGLAFAGAGQLVGQGVSPDSIQRFLDILDRVGYRRPAERSAPEARESGSVLLRLDYAVSDGDRLTARLDARGSRAPVAGGDLLAIPSSEGRARSESLGSLLQLASRRGAFSNELRGYWSGGSSRLESGMESPRGLVHVVSDLDAAGQGAAGLGFGGPSEGAETRSSLYEVADELSYEAGAHTGRIGVMLSEEARTGESGANRSGTFTFNSLADLEQGRASSFSRTLASRRVGAVGRYAAAFAGDTWRPNQKLWVTYGVRAEGRMYRGRETEAERGRIGWRWGLSPRVGITYSGENWTLRGGAGEFRGILELDRLAGAFAETGDAADQLVCLGPATPTPRWSDYAADPASVPSECTGSPAFADRAPRITRFGRGVGAPLTRRASLAAGRNLTTAFGQMALRAELSATAGLNQPLAFDPNLRAAPAFALDAEGGRPVYALPAAIDSATGAVAPGASRAGDDPRMIRLQSSGGRSRTVQLSVGANILTRSLAVLGASYTYTRSVDEVGPLAGLNHGSAPLAALAPGLAPLRATSDLERRHVVQVIGTRHFARWRTELGVIGRFMSGAPYTPLVSGDVDGDGVQNDRAFVFGPVASEEMATLLDDAPAGARACLRRNLGRVAERNSCRGPWSASLDVQVNAWPGQKLNSRRLILSLTAANLPAGADRLLHGAGGLRGWGGEADVDPVLLSTRGFDPDQRRYRYEVNPAFGTARPGPGSRSFTVTLQARWTLGADPVRQPLLASLAASRGRARSYEEYRQTLSRTLPDLPGQVLALDDTLRLALTGAQRLGLDALRDTAGARLATAADSLARLAASRDAAGRGEDSRRLGRELSVASDAVMAVLAETAARIQTLLTPAQWARLPGSVRQPRRQLLRLAPAVTLEH